MGMIDTDAHVFETPRTWEYMEPAEQKFAPRIVEQIYGNERRGLAGNVWKRYWLVDKTAISLESNIDPALTKGQRDLEDVDARVAHMDQLGVDVQVIFPSFFLHPYTRNQEMEFALTRAYNRWMGDIWKKGKGRLRWIAVPPVLQIAKARAELEFARDHGACGVLMHGIEHERLLTDPYFFPLYEAADDLGLAITVHAGYNSPAYEQIFRGAGGMVEFRFPVITAFHNLMMKDIPKQYPNIRWGFIEAGAQWVPMVMQDLAVRYRDLLKQELPKDLFAQRKVYVTCQADDDVPYILKFAGEDSLVVGTDYGHSDHAADIDVFDFLKHKSGIERRIVDKIIDTNGRRLYGLN